jgi:hypothetical protein
MAVSAGAGAVKESGQLVAVEGVIGGSVIETARTLAASARDSRGVISVWDGSGIFSEVAVTEEIAGRPSARTLLLLYASDLVFRLRSEVQPALDSGAMVVVAPYVETAIAFGRAAGIDTRWIADMFAFAPKSASVHYVKAATPSSSERPGFVEFSARQIVAPGNERAARALVDDTDRHLRALIRSAKRALSISPTATSPPGR